MLTEEIVQSLATELVTAGQKRTQVPHFSKRYPGMRVNDGYRVSHAWSSARLAQGRKLIGYKIGLTSHTSQLSSKTDEPAYGYLLDDMHYNCLAGQVLDLPAESFIAPHMEAELAFVLRSALIGPNITVEQVLAATDYIAPAVEIIDFRIEQRDRFTGDMRSVVDMISDNAASAGIVIGTERMQARDADIPWIGAVLRRNGIIENTGLAAAVQGHPAITIAWLANKLALQGVALQAGQILLSGSFFPPIAAKVGNLFEVDYGRLGSLAITFS